MFNDLFETAQTGHRIDLLTHAGRSQITAQTVNWWQSHGWQVVCWDNTGHRPAVGRNKIIQDFQQSNRTLLIMADDDITLYKHRYLTAQWLKQPLAHGIYTLNSNHKMGIFKYNSKAWDDGQHHWLETAEISQFYVINNKDIPLQNEQLPALEDVEWAQRCNKQGIKTYLLHTVFLREQSQDRGSLIAKTRAERKQLYAEAKQMIQQLEIESSLPH